MKVMVVGSGAREHALAWGLARSPKVTKVICAPGNAGTALFTDSVPIKADNVEAVVDAAKSSGVDLVVVGPEVPLVAGLVDALEAAGIAAFGPRKEAAQLEGSKVFSKRFMEANAIPTASFEVFQDASLAEAYVKNHRGPLVVKADGLAAGKGVIVCKTTEQALDAVDRVMRRREFGTAGDAAVIEDCLVGEEVSYHVVTDGERFVPLAESQDHKPLLDGDRGPNTGGMGAYSPPPIVTPELERTIIERVVKPTLDGLRRRAITYRGALYCGLMIVNGEPFVLEYNVRFGDPETQALLTRWQGDLVDLLMGSARGDLRGVNPAWEAPASVCVVLASEGYPGSYPKGLEICGLDSVNAEPGVEVFHAGTKRVDGKIVTDGGRVLSVTAYGSDIDQAADKAYRAVSRIEFDGVQYRRDIGWRARKGFARPRS
jgi:phosphoribosylamine--glycine ligase